MGVNHAALLSGGLVVGAPLGPALFPYLAAGGGFAEAASSSGSDRLLHWHARAGIGWALDVERRHMVSLDVGGWYGVHEEKERDTDGSWTTRSRRFAWPMAGLGYLIAF